MGISLLLAGTSVEPSQRPLPLTALTDSTSAWRISLPSIITSESCTGPNTCSCQSNNTRYSNGASTPPSTRAKVVRSGQRTRRVWGSCRKRNARNCACESVAA